jgi:hypothetical protein
MLKVGTLCYEKEKQYLGIVLEIKRIKKQQNLEIK